MRVCIYYTSQEYEILRRESSHHKISFCMSVCLPFPCTYREGKVTTTKSPLAHGDGQKPHDLMNCVTVPVKVCTMSPTAPLQCMRSWITSHTVGRNATTQQPNSNHRDKSSSLEHNERYILQVYPKTRYWELSQMALWLGLYMNLFCKSRHQAFQC